MAEPRTAEQIMADVHALHAARAAEEGLQAWPEPERRATPTTALPRGPKAITGMLRDDQWSATTARGPVSKQGKGNPWRMAESIVVRGVTGQRRFVATWIETPAGGMSFHSAYAHGVEGRVTLEQLKYYLTADIGIPWIEGIGPLPREGSQ